MNTLELDPALQVGADKTASHIANPPLLLNGNGSGSLFDVRVDGFLVANVRCDNFNHAWIQCPPLAEGKHRAVAQETSPVPADPPIVFDFTVDTIPDPVPSTPSLIGHPGNPVTSKQSTFGLTGTAQPGSGVRCYSDTIFFGGGSVGTDGVWYVTVPNMPDGDYRVAARSLDPAGNNSAFSEPLLLTVAANVAPPPQGIPGAPGLAIKSTMGIVSWAPPPPVDPPVTGYRVYRGGSLIAELGPGDRQFSFANIRPGETFAVSAVNGRGEGERLAISLP